MTSQVDHVVSDAFAEPIVAAPGNRPLHIAWCHTGDSGGSKRAAFEMVRELSRRGHVIDEYIIRIGEPNRGHWPLKPFVRQSYEHLLPMSVNSLRPHLVHSWVQWVQDRIKLRALRSMLIGVAADIEGRRYDYVHLDHCSPSYTVVLAALVHLPSVVYSHEVSGARYGSAPRRSDTPASSALRRLYEWGCECATGLTDAFRQEQDLIGLAHAGAVLTNSHFSKEAMFQRARHLCAVSRYGVDTSTFKLSEKALQPVVLSAGRLVEAKQHHIIVEAIGRLPRDGRPRLIIATPEAITHQEQPAYAERLTQLAKACDVELEIKRNPSERELVSLYGEAWMLVFVPLMEPFGLVALEAMACGTPVIGVREGGIRESVVDGRSGLLIERDPDEVARAIRILLEQPELRLRMGAEAAAYVRREWSWRGSVDRYESEVRKVLAARRPESEPQGRSGEDQA